jgi:hypothetical protein
MSNNPHVISLDEAKSMTHAYQNAAQFQGLTVASMIDKDAYQLVMDQPGCVNIRTYFALNEAGTLTIVVVGVDDNGDDMTQGVLLDKANNCPINCSVVSELMI